MLGARYTHGRPREENPWKASPGTPMAGLARYTYGRPHQVHPWQASPGQTGAGLARYTHGRPRQVHPWPASPGTPMEGLARYIRSRPRQVHAGTQTYKTVGTMFFILWIDDFYICRMFSVIFIFCLCARWDIHGCQNSVWSRVWMLFQLHRLWAGFI